jgi:rhodanese-related sulfurtransferase
MPQGNVAPGRAEYRSIGPAEAEPLVRGNEVTVLDVRTPGEYERLGHIPGALLLPVDFAVSAPAVLPREPRPVLVVCEHGVRSVRASQVLATAGVPDVLNLSGGMARWSGPREFSPGRMRGPSEWLLRQGRQLPPGGRALDAACGAGRHALVLAGAGYAVTAIDRDEDAIARLSATASRLGLPVEAETRDLEQDGVDLGDACYDLIVGFRYLHRPLFPALVRALRPGGLLVYETFTRAQAEAGRKPSNPAFLLEPGELARLVAPLEIVDAREGDVDGDHVASVAARKPA